MTSPISTTRPRATSVQTPARERVALAAALAFLDAAAIGALGPDELRVWVQEHLVAAGWMDWPGKVREDGVDSSLLPAEESYPESLVEAARSRVVATLRAFVGAARDDRFLVAAIYAGRVQRDSRGKTTGWAPRLRVDDALSDIVLSLFAADILEHRDAYEAGLAVCSRCDRVSLDPAARGRVRCPCRSAAHQEELLD